MRDWKGTKPFCNNGHDLSKTRFFHKNNTKHGGSFRCSICWKEQARIRLLRAYKLTKSDFDNINLKQGGLCAICLNPPEVKYKGLLHVDHDHKTGKVRGLLCGHCNQGIGHFKDNKDILIRAIKYLEKEAS